MKNLITLFLLLFVVPVFSLSAQDIKELKACLQQGNKNLTPQLAGSNPAIKPAAAKANSIYKGDISSSASRVPKPVKKPDPISLAQLQMKMSKAGSMLDEVTVYSSVGNQRAPNITSDEYEKFVVFENEDTQGGSYPFGTIDVYSSSDGGASWQYFDGLYNSSYRLTLPRILLVGTDVIVAYLSNGNFWTYKWDRLDGSYISSAVSAPIVSATEFVVDFRIVSDVEDGSTFPYLYAAFIFKQSDGTQRVLFSRSTDTIRTWESFFTLGATKSELGMFSLGLDYCSSGVFVAYLGADTSAGSVLIRKSTLYGTESSWTPEVKLPMYYNGGNNKKLGPEISAIGSRVAIIYQYDYYGDASDWKSASDFDIYAVVSNDGGVSWEERMVNSTFSSEILPSISCDYDGNFYVAYIRDSRVRISMAGQEFVFGVADSSMSANPSFNVFPSICGAAVPYNNTAYTVWTNVDNTTAADILGSETVLKIPPASPTDLVVTPVTGNEVKLTWTDNSMDESGFAIFSRQAGTPDEFARIGTVAANTIAFTTTLTSSSGNNYYVRAYNENGFSLRTNIETAYPSVIDNTPPIVTLNPTTGTPVVVLANGQILTTPRVNATASDAETGIKQMQVAYRNTLQQTWSNETFVGSSTISCEIPLSTFVNNNKPIGVDYRVGAWDNADNVTWSDYASFEVQMGPLVTDQPPFSFPAASQLENKTTAYRMISVPYNLSNKRPANLLNSFGDHAENGVSYVKWRFQRYASGQYQDFDQFSTQNAVTPGAAFFLIIKDQGLQITVQGESLNRSDVMYNTGISLQTGWNLVGNPFTIQYPLNDLEFFPASAPTTRGTIRQFAFYSGSGVVSGWDTSRVSISTLKPWSGVAVFVNSAGTLRFPSAGQLSGLPKEPVSQPAKINAPEWTLAINAYRPEIGMRCEGSTIGMTKGASEGDDAYDSYIPPIVGDKNVAVYFKNADGAMIRDIRPLSKEGNIWEMKVVTGDANARVNLQWNNDLNLPDPAFEAYLIDTDQKTAHNLKHIKSLEINSGDGIRSFRVVIGKKSFVEVNNAGVAIVPSSVKLYANYPNPFNPETVIRYSLPESSESYTVELKVFNVLGQEIATLVNERKSSGYYEAKFNGANQSSGIYFYQLSVTGGNKTYREIKKMVLMR